MSKTAEQIREELDQDIPRETVSSRSAGQGRSLSYLESWYVIDRLNKIFGQGNWQYGVESLNKTFEGKVNDKHYVSYIATVRLSYRMPSALLSTFTDLSTITDVGFGDGTEAYNPGKAHELATKEAVTDALKRCAKSLGMSMGLALYNKAQDNVSDEKPKKVEAPQVSAKPIATPPPAVGHAPKEAPKPKGDIKKLVKEAARAAFTKNITTVDKFREKLSNDYSAGKVDDLNDTQAASLYQYMKTTFKELELQ